MITNFKILVILPNLMLFSLPFVHNLRNSDHDLDNEDQVCEKMIVFLTACFVEYTRSVILMYISIVRQSLSIVLINIFVIM